MSANVKGLTADEVLKRLRAGQQCRQSLYQDGRIHDPLWGRVLSWRFEDGTQVTASAVSMLRRRGQIAVSESVSYRFLRVISERSCNACVDSSRG
jgi:hypothetical protein